MLVIPPVAPIALAAPATVITVPSCTEPSLQSAIDQVVPGIVLTVQYQESDCTIALTSPLVIPPGANVTIDGAGLTLDGQQSPAGVLTIQSGAGRTTLELSNVTLAYGAVEVSLLTSFDTPGDLGYPNMSCWIRMSEPRAGGDVQLNGCQAINLPGASGLGLTCRKQSISDSSKKWVCFGAGRTGGGGYVSYTAISVLGPAGGHLVLSTHYRYGTYRWQRATARCGIILRRGVGPSLTVTCQASQAAQG